MPAKPYTNGGDSTDNTAASTIPPLAVIGMSFRGPGDASNVEKLYKLVSEAREAWSPIPESRWTKDAFYHPDPSRKGTSNVQGGHFLQHDLTRFDAAFFGMREDEAACLDPQQRILLECCYEALENGGIPLAKAYGSKTSVFVGTFGADYPELLYRDPETIPMYQATNAGNSRAIISNRLSYVFNFKGPSVTVDTACSASLVAFHIACQSLWSGDADQAIVGGSSIILNSDLLNSMSAMGFLSPEGRCYSFDERAQGYGRGEGVGCVMLKPLHQALKDGDPVRAIVRSTASNQDGKTTGITVPSRAAQESLIRSAYSKAGLDPLHTDYVEAHGTGTQAGDPIEAGAIATVFGASRPPSSPVKIGSVKSNIGHLEGASGVAGIIKAVLMLENQAMLPSRNFQRPNSQIPLSEWNVEVSTKLSPWITDGPRRVSINSFGYGGTNAHAVLEDPATFFRDHPVPMRSFASIIRTDGEQHANEFGKAPNGTRFCNEIDLHSASANGNSPAKGTTHGLVRGFQTSGRRRLFQFSAFDQDCGPRLARAFAKYLKQGHLNDTDLDNLAFTLHCRRSRFPWRASVVAQNVEELIDTLGQDEFRLTKTRINQPVVGFVFTGQGAQWARMGVELMDDFPAYRRSLERSRDQLKKLEASWDLIDELLKGKAESRVDEAEFSQPICTALQCALVDLLASWNVTPAAVTGHSSGEIAAAYCAGAMSLEATMTAAYYRGIVAASLEVPGKLSRKGAMMAVAMSKAEITPLIEELQSGRVCVACENSPSSVTISGDASAVDELYSVLQQRYDGLFVRKLKVNVAYHSHHMKVIGDEYLACIPKIEAPEDRNISFYSSVTGVKVDPAELGPEYWVTNLLSEVRFATSLSQLCHGASGEGRKVDVLVEIGPHSALGGPIKQILNADPDLKKAKVTYLSPLTRNKSAAETTLHALARLTTEGVAVDVSAINQPADPSSLRCLLGLPEYSWNHNKSFWAEGRISEAYRKRQFPRTDVLGIEDRNSNPLEPRWRNIVRLSEVPWVQDHKVQDNIVYPAGGFIAMAIEAAQQRAIRSGRAIDGYQLREVTIPQALVIPRATGQVETAVTVRSYREGTQWSSDVWDEFTVYSVAPNNEWTEHCRGLISAVNSRPESDFGGAANANIAGARYVMEVNEALARCWRPVDVEAFYNELRGAGLDYGSTFANVVNAQTGSNECMASLTVPNTPSVMPHLYEHSIPVHPATIDTILHPMLAAAAADAAHGHDKFDPFVPVFAKEMYFSAHIPAAAGSRIRAYAVNKPSQPRSLESSIRVTDDNDQPAHLYGYINELTCKALARDHARETANGTSNKAWKISWGVDADFLPPAGHSSPSSGQLEDTLRLLGFKNPQMKLLWISREVVPERFSSVLQSLAADEDALRLAQCHVCTSDPASRDLIESHLQPLGNLVASQLFDFDMETMRNQLKPASYDLVVVEGSGLSAVFGNELPPALFQLLRLGGRLIVLESDTFSDPSISQVNGTCISAVNWKTALPRAGFSGFNERVVNDKTRVIVSSALPPKRPDSAAVAVIVDDHHSEEAHSARLLAGRLVTKGFNASVVTPAEANVSSSFCIVLADISGRILSHPSGEHFEFVKASFTRSLGILWVTRGGYSNNPLANIAPGLARTIRSENGTAMTVTLDLDGGSQLSADDTAVLIARLAVSRFGVDWGSLDDVDMEYRELNGSLLIPRLVQDDEVNNHVATATTDGILTQQPLLQPNRNLRMDLGTPGLISSILWVNDDSITGDIADNCIEVQVKASGVNFRDVMMAIGQIAVDQPGGECSGIVTAVGKSVTTFRRGDRVAGLHLGSFATRVQPKASIMRHIPLGLGLSDAAALPVAYVTAYYSLFELARVRPGETVLIHAATGGVGQAALEICQFLGAEIFVTVGSQGKKQFVLDHYPVREDHIFSSRDGSFAPGIMAVTENRGVDVILNSVAGEAHRLTWNCIGPFGRFIELGKRDISVNTRLEMQRFARNVTFSTFDLVDLIRSRPTTCGLVWERILELLNAGCIQVPSAITSYAMAETPKALQLMQSGKHIGKLVSVMSPTDMVMAPPVRSTQNALRHDASYLIVGGLGGLGRVIAKWMIRQGARHLIFANRSAASSERSQVILRELEGYGAQVHVRACDVACERQVQHLLVSTESERIPPVKGVIHSAMLLRDAMFNKMSLDQYRQGLRAKVQGTLALHKYLPKDLDFFVFLSSMNGVIGNASQANYAAANTFLDAFAEYRNRLGLAGTALDLGVITDAGHVSENPELAKSMARQGFAGTSERELLALIEHAIFHPCRPAGMNQVVTGLGGWHENALGNLRRPMFSHFRHITGSHDAQGETDDGLGNITNLSLEDGAARICDALRGKVSDLCMLSLDDVLPSKTLSQYGMDSLVAVEMRNWISRKFNQTIPILELLSNNSLSALSVQIVSKLKEVSNG